MANIGQNLRTSLPRLAVLVTLAASVKLAALLHVPLAAQAPLRAEPDLRGVWAYETITPLERPQELGDKAFFTKAEAEIYEKQVAAANNKDRRDGTAQEDVARAYNEAWWDRGTQVVSTLRTSLIVEPKDGRIPPLKPQARAAAQMRAQIQAGPPRGPEDRGVGERCIAGRNAGPPFVPVAYNNNLQIFQSPGQVVILNEMMHDFRVVRTDGSPALPPQFRFWLGHSRGHWEGETLVVDTTNFNEQVHFQGSDENLHVIERFTRVGPGEILYQFRIEDPTAFERPWAGEIPLRATPGPIYEYACHEGNYSLSGLLAGARAEEAGK
jgi:hypothetical protein